MNGEHSGYEAQIVRSWHVNAQLWSNAVRTASIASRKLVTDQALISAVQKVGPAHVLDIGCGEGWLARALTPLGIEVLGIDVVPALITEAARSSPGRFKVCSYSQVAAWESEGLEHGSFSAAVCNFSLLGDESVETMLSAIPSYLQDSGYLIVQTLHPVAACGKHAYADGWRAGTWDGFSAEFSDPPALVFSHALELVCDVATLRFRGNRNR